MTSESIVEDNIKLIYKIANSFYGVSKEDLVQAGMLGILKAYKNYDSKGGAKFSTYAYEYIYGEMYLIANKKAIKVNTNTLRLYKKLEKIRYEEAQKIGRIPSNEELSLIMNIDIETINYACMSAVAILSVDDDKEDIKNMHEVLYKEDSITLDDKILLEDSLNSLTSEEKEVIKKRYYEDQTQNSVAKDLNMTQVKICRMEKQGLAKMKKYIKS